MEPSTIEQQFVHERPLSTEADLASSSSSSNSRSFDISSAKRATAAVAAAVEDVAYDNPRTWSTPRKCMITAIVCVMTLSLTFASSAYTSSTAHLIAQFQVSQEVVLLGVALYLFGFVLGPLLFGPAAQVFGHRNVYVLTFLLFTAFSFGVSEANSMATVLVCRFFAAVFGASAWSNASATIGDIVLPFNAFRYIINFGLAAFAGPGLGPLIGAYVDSRAGWRWNMRVQAIFAGLLTVICFFFLPETNHIVLQQRANARSEKNRGQPPTMWQKLFIVLQKYKVTLSQPFIVLFTEPVVLAISLYLGVLYAVLYLSFVVIPIVFIEIRHFTPEHQGLTYISLMIGFITSAAFMVLCQDRFFKQYDGERPPPEMRLRQTVYTAILAPIGLFIFAWTGPFVHVHWIGPCIGLCVTFFGVNTIFSSCIPYLVEYSGPRAPIILAGSTALRCAMAGAFPLFGRQMYDSLTVQGGCSLLAAIALLMTPLPGILYVYGARLRSKNAK